MDWVLMQAPFQRLVREITQNIPNKEGDLRWRPSAIEALQVSIRLLGCKK